jgi:GGDEF domain-containing protein
VAIAKTVEEAKNALEERNVYLATVDINLSGELFRDKAAEGMEVLAEIKKAYPHVCPVVISSEEISKYQKTALRNYEAIDYIQKSKLVEDEAEIKNLFKTTFIYAEALRLFTAGEKERRKGGEWSQSEKIWQAIAEGNPQFVEIDKDTKNLGVKLDQKKNYLTKLPGREWVWNELDRLRQALSRSNWAILLVSINGFSAFQDARKLTGAEEVLKHIAKELKKIIKDRLANTHTSLEDLLLLFQNPGDIEIANGGIFLGEIDNTGLFVLITPSRQVAEEIKQAIDSEITTEALKSFHAKLEGGQEGLMSVSTTIVTADNIRKIEPIPPASDAESEFSVPRDRFEQLLFGRDVDETASKNQIVYEDTSPDNDKKKKKRWFSFFRS